MGGATMLVSSTFIPLVTLIETYKNYTWAGLYVSFLAALSTLATLCIHSREPTDYSFDGPSFRRPSESAFRRPSLRSMA
jgi:hypothetical protein